MARKVIKSKKSHKPSKKARKSKFSLPAGWTVYTKKHTDKVKMLDAVLYKHKNDLPMGKSEMRVLEELDQHSMTYSFENGCHVFKCTKSPQSLNVRDSSRWFMKKQYQAIWDGIVLKMLNQQSLTTPLTGSFILFYQPYRKRLLDMDNSASGVKSIIDAFVHMGVLVDDNEKVVYDYKPCRPIKSKDEFIVLRFLPVEYGSRCEHVVHMPSGRVVKI